MPASRRFRLRRWKCESSSISFRAPVLRRCGESGQGGVAGRRGASPVRPLGPPLSLTLLLLPLSRLLAPRTAAVQELVDASTRRLAQPTYPPTRAVRLAVRLAAALSPRHGAHPRRLDQLLAGLGHGRHRNGRLRPAHRDQRRPTAQRDGPGLSFRLVDRRRRQPRRHCAARRAADAGRLGGVVLRRRWGSRT